MTLFAIIIYSTNSTFTFSVCFVPQLLLLLVNKFRILKQLLLSLSCGNSFKVKAVNKERRQIGTRCGTYILNFTLNLTHTYSISISILHTQTQSLSVSLSHTHIFNRSLSLSHTHTHTHLFHQIMKIVHLYYCDVLYCC